jgi:protein subunit release factor B
MLMFSPFGSFLRRSFSNFGSKLLKDHLPKPIPVILNENELEEKFVLGSGRGGQKINKTSSCVQLKHLPTGIIIETQRFRELSKNRKEARKLLTRKLDELWNGELSKTAQKVKKIKKSLAKRKARAQAKYGTKNDSDMKSESGELCPVEKHDPKDEKP